MTSATVYVLGVKGSIHEEMGVGGFAVSAVRCVGPVRLQVKGQNSPCTCCAPKNVRPDSLNVTDAGRPGWRKRMVHAEHVT